ncbi:MAG: efflux RND transporter periplasmic adaptor subunit [Beijerinckiaceae bacterium]|jgi:multidrug efflux pump subunit AcrA (membrane-fusion protein)|nr:efflux RND transporter periplasmic adaptor subunit [Beijerinckiaceae bacterium]
MIRRSRFLMVALPLAAAGALTLATLSIVRSNTTPAVAPAGAARSTIVAGAGVVEPAGREIAVATPVAGVVRNVRVNPGDAVKQGDILFTLDDAIVAATLAQRQQDLRAAEIRLTQTKGRVDQLRAEMEAARGAVEAARAERDEAKDQVDTGAQLVGGAVSQRELTRRRNALRGAEGRLAEAGARFDGTRAALALIDPAQQGASWLADQQAVQQAQAAVDLARREQERLFIRAPSNGTILAVNIRAGEFAAAGGATAPVSMGMLTPLHVRVDIDEADLPRLALGRNAVGARRGLPAETIALRFVRAEPILTSKRSLVGGADERVDTRVLQLIYAVETPEIDLRPGQILDVRIDSPKPAQG